MHLLNKTYFQQSLSAGQSLHLSGGNQPQSGSGQFGAGFGTFVSPSLWLGRLRGWQQDGSMEQHGLIGRKLKCKTAFLPSKIQRFWLIKFLEYDNIVQVQDRVSLVLASEHRNVKKPIYYIKMASATVKSLHRIHVHSCLQVEITHTFQWLCFCKGS